LSFTVSTIIQHTICTDLEIAQIDQLMTVKSITNILQICIEQ